MNLNKDNSLNLKINQQAYWDYLTYRYIPGDQTSYNKILKFDRGTIYKIQKQNNIKKNIGELDFKIKNIPFENKLINFQNLINQLKKD